MVSPKEFKVVLDNETLYIDQQLAEALGWKQDQDLGGVPLTLSGWAPSYFAIARTGSESGTALADEPLLTVPS